MINLEDKCPEIVVTLLIIGSVLSLYFGSAGFHRFPVFLWVAKLILVAGIAILIWIFFLRRKDKAMGFTEGDSTLICPRCQTPQDYQFYNKPCPICSTPLEPLHGFYDRHPELRDLDEVESVNEEEKTK